MLKEDIAQKIEKLHSQASRDFISIGTELSQNLSQANQLEDTDYDAKLKNLQQRINSLHILPAVAPKELTKGIDEKKSKDSIKVAQRKKKK
jgi:hypothetical protein